MNWQKDTAYECKMNLHIQFKVIFEIRQQLCVFININYFVAVVVVVVIVAVVVLVSVVVVFSSKIYCHVKLQILMINYIHESFIIELSVLSVPDRVIFEVTKMFPFVNVIVVVFYAVAVADSPGNHL